jgi:hypothetical protein
MDAQKGKRARSVSVVGLASGRIFRAAIFRVSGVIRGSMSFNLIHGFLFPNICPCPNENSNAIAII